MNTHETSLNIWTQGQERDPSYLPFFSSRACKQVVRLMDTNTLMRTLDGTLTCTTLYGHKYRSAITGQDRMPMALEGLTRGKSLWIDSLVHFTCPLTPQQETQHLSRTPVPGSVCLHTPEETVTLHERGADVSFSEHDVPEDSFLSYRPRLLMAVTNITITANEWQHTEEWQLDLEEI